MVGGVVVPIGRLRQTKRPPLVESARGVRPARRGCDGARRVAVASFTRGVARGVARRLGGSVLLMADKPYSLAAGWTNTRSALSEDCLKNECPPGVSLRAGFWLVPQLARLLLELGARSSLRSDPEELGGSERSRFSVSGSSDRRCRPSRTRSRSTARPRLDRPSSKHTRTCSRRPREASPRPPPGHGWVPAETVPEAADRLRHHWVCPGVESYGTQKNPTT